MTRAAEHCLALSQGAMQSMLPSLAFRVALVAHIYDRMLIAHIWSQPCSSTLGINMTELHLHCMGRNQNFTLFVKVHLYKVNLRSTKEKKLF